MTTRAVYILLVEDTPSDAELVLASLAKVVQRERIHVVPDGLLALDFLFCRNEYAGRASSAPPFVVLLDVKLPKVDGLEVLRQLKADPLTQSIPVVMLTSSNIESDVATAYRLGANSYIQKPMDFEQFRETVRAVGRYWLAMNESLPAAPHTAGGAP